MDPTTVDALALRVQHRATGLMPHIGNPIFLRAYLNDCSNDFISGGAMRRVRSSVCY